MKKIRIGVIGAGRWGPNLIRNYYTNLNSEVAVVVDQNEARLKLIEERYPGVATTTSTDLLISDPMIDAVVVCTPTVTHFDLAKAALENKKHVFVEKPLASTSEECATLVKIARKEKRVLFVGHVFVYNAGIQSVRRYIESGQLGKIDYIQILRTNLGPVRTDVNALWDLGSHDLSILQYWLGKMPEAVNAVGGCFLNNKIEDVVFATYRFPGNILANIHVSWLNPKKVREIVVVGEKKMLTWDDLDLNYPIKLYDKNISIDSPDNKLVDTFMSFHANIHEGDTLVPKIQLNEPLLAECNAFLEAIKKPATSLSTGEHGLQVVQALEATSQSLRDKGREVRIDYV
jgi:predicted dehydrogenase